MPQPVDEDPQITEGLKIFPNPASTSFTISFNKSIKLIRMVDKTGRIHKTFSYINNLKSQSISTLGLQPDVYTIIISDGEKEYTSKVVIL